MSAWTTYRLYRPQGRGTGGYDDSYGPMIPTTRTFKARTQNEAESKARRFLVSAQIRLGVFEMKKEKQDGKE